MMDICRNTIETSHGGVHLRMTTPHDSNLTPLLCLHMTPQSGEEFEPLMNSIGADRLIVAPDYPGYGDSDPLSDESQATIETYADAIWQVLDAQDILQVDILGYHTGSKVAIEMALQHPNRVLKLYCISLSTPLPEKLDLKAPVFKPLIDVQGNLFPENWLDVLKNYYDSALPETNLKKKYETSLRAGTRSHLGFRASYDYNSRILKKLNQLTTPLVLFNPNDDLKKITPCAVDYIRHCVLIEKPHWHPGFLDIKPKEVMEAISSASRQLDKADKRAQARLAY